MSETTKHTPGPWQEADPILSPSSEPWDRTVRAYQFRHTGAVMYAGEIADPGPTATPGTLDTVTGVFTPDPKE